MRKGLRKRDKAEQSSSVSDREDGKIEQPEREKKRKKNWKLPELSLGWRLFLYFITLVFSFLSVASLFVASVWEGFKIALYVPAFVGLVLSSCYLFTNSRKGARKTIRVLKERSSFFNRVMTNDFFRAFLFAIPGFGIGLVFAAFNAAVGVISRSAWYLSLAVYYILLCLMRFFLLRRFFFESKKGKNPVRDWKLYALCGRILMGMSVALSSVVVLMVIDGYSKSYPGYLIYVVAFYTFYKVIFSVVHMARARRLSSPLLSGIRNIGYADALVSLLSLQTAMFASFGKSEVRLSTVMNACTGAVVCLMVVLLGGYMLVNSRKRLSALSKERQKESAFPSCPKEEQNRKDG